MSAFEWRDLSGTMRCLTSYAPIETALETVRLNLRQHDLDLGSADVTRVRAAMRATDVLVAEYNRLIGDLERWTLNADTANAQACENAKAEIEKLVEDVLATRKLHACWAEWHRLSAAAAASHADQLVVETGRSTDLQRSVIALFRDGGDTFDASTATGRQAMDWIIDQPRSCRITRPAAEPAYMAIDRDGLPMETRSLLAIEVELLAVVDRLAALLPDLGSKSAAAMATALGSVGAVTKAFDVIQCSLVGWTAHVDAMDMAAAKSRRDEIRKI